MRACPHVFQVFNFSAFLWRGDAIYKFDAQQTNMPRLQVEPKKNIGSTAWSFVSKIAGIYGGSSPKYRISIGIHRFSSIAEEYVLDYWHSFLT